MSMTAKAALVQMLSDDREERDEVDFRSEYGSGVVVEADVDEVGGAEPEVAAGLGPVG